MSPFGREHEDLVLEDVELDALDELGRVDSETSRCQSMSWRSQASLASYSRSDLVPSL